MVTALLGDRISPAALRLVALLVGRGRGNALPQVSEEYNRQLNAHRGVVEATVTSAVPLTADETAAIRSRVEAMAGSDVELRTEVNPDLIGGLTIQVRDRLRDLREHPGHGFRAEPLAGLGDPAPGRLRTIRRFTHS